MRARATVVENDLGMNKLEVKYSQNLELLRLAGEVLRWDFEPERLRLAYRTFYTPDFRVILPNLEIRFDEVKGHWEDDARVKIKVAAKLHPYQFMGVQWSRRDGGWLYERF